MRTSVIRASELECDMTASDDELVKAMGFEILKRLGNSLASSIDAARLAIEIGKKLGRITDVQTRIDDKLRIQANESASIVIGLGPVSFILWYFGAEPTWGSTLIAVMGWSICTWCRIAWRKWKRSRV